VHDYRGGRLATTPTSHRLDASATADLGLEELGVRDGILVIEWPDRPRTILLMRVASR
jgi:tRNA A37 threonylcarbamoyladenosine biosynthesis protein TsaE